jgi:hypothetical protein
VFASLYEVGAEHSAEDSAILSALTMAHQDRLKFLARTGGPAKPSSPAPRSLTPPTQLNWTPPAPPNRAYPLVKHSVRSRILCKQEVAGSSPAVSTDEVPGKRPVHLNL